MSDKLTTEKEKMQSLDTIIMLLEILNQIDEVDLLGNSIPMKIKVLNKIDSLLDKI